MQHAKGGLAQWLRNGELIHFFVVALLQIDDLALAGATDKDHRKAIGGGVGQGREPIEKPGRGYCQADARLLGKETGDGRRIAGVLFVAKCDHAHALSLRHAGQIRDRNAGQPINCIDPVKFQRIDDQMKPVSCFLWR